jgi:hypothetical protein
MAKMEKLKGQATQEQIADWKKKYNNVFQVSAENKAGYIRAPRRAEIGLAFSYMAANPLKATETILQSCWLGGCEELRDDDKYFYGLNSQINEIIEMAEVEIKKL